MADDSNSTFYLNLDSSDFVSSAADAKSAIIQLGNSENLSGLIEGFEKVGLVAGVLGATFLALKESMDLVFDAENIKQVNAQFDNLSQSAGVFSDKLKAGLIESSKGWVDETTLMKAANKAMTELEVGVDKLPDVMELARKASSVFGGDITQNFETISNAVAAGNTRMLRHLGIIVDQQKAYRNYAASIGTTVGALSKAGQQQAVLNAVLEIGKSKFGNVNEDIRENLNLWTELKASAKEIGDILALAFDGIAGHAMSNFFRMLKNNLDSTKTWLQATFGHGSEQAAAGLKLVNDRIAETKQKIQDIEQHKGIGAAMTTGEAQIQLQLLNTQLQKYEQELGKASEADKKFAQERKERESAAASSGTKGNSGVDPVKQAEQEAKAKSELLAIDKQITQQKIQEADSAKEAAQLYQKQLDEEGKQYDLQLEKVRASVAAGTLTKAQGAKEEQKINELKNLAIARDDDKLTALELQAEQKRLSDATRIDEQLAASASVNARQAADAWKKSGQLGGAAMNSFQSNATAAFKAIGDGSKTAGDAMRDAFMSMLGDIASKQGEFMMLDAFKTFPAINAPEFGAGAALVALGGALGSVGGASSSTAIGGGSSLGNTTGTANTPSPAPGPGLASQTQSGRSVQLVVQGNVFSNDQTQRWLVDQIRAASDATDFKITSIGGGI